MCTQQVFIFKRPRLNPSYYSSFRYDRTRHQPYSKDQHLIGSRYILHIKQLEGEVMLNYSPVQFSKVHNLDTIGINICRNIPSLSSLAQSPMHLRISTNHRRKTIRMRTWELHTHWALTPKQRIPSGNTSHSSPTCDHRNGHTASVRPPAVEQSSPWLPVPQWPRASSAKYPNR